MKIFSAAKALGPLAGAADVKQPGLRRAKRIYVEFLQERIMSSKSPDQPGAAVPGPVYLVVDGLPATAIAAAPLVTYCQSPNGSLMVWLLPVTYSGTAP